MISGFTRRLLITVFVSLIGFPISYAVAEKPIQHLQLPDIESYAKAKEVFTQTTNTLTHKPQLDDQAMHDIHMTTYSLEKAVAYFVKNFNGEQQAAAKKLAAVVELIHISSENNRPAEVEVYLNYYEDSAQAFLASLP